MADPRVPLREHPREIEWLQALTQEASRALTSLVDIGALIRIKPGRYRINPHVGWSGPLHKRDQVAKEARPVAPGPLLVVMEGGKL